MSIINELTTFSALFLNDTVKTNDGLTNLVKNVKTSTNELHFPASQNNPRVSFWDVSVANKACWYKFTLQAKGADLTLTIERTNIKQDKVNKTVCLPVKTGQSWLEARKAARALWASTPTPCQCFKY